MRLVELNFAENVAFIIILFTINYYNSIIYLYHILSLLTLDR